MARKKLNLTGALEEIIQREQEAQRLFEESGRREQLFRSEEERETDEALLLEEESDTPEAKTLTLDLPDPSEVIRVEQSIYGNVPTNRPDRKKEYGYYDSNSLERPMSTRVQGIQWIPTSSIAIDEKLLEDPKGMLYGYGSGIYGDILVAFARPSKAQSHAIYVFSGNNISNWHVLLGSSSLGRGIKSLSGGKLLQGSDEARYKEIHGETDTKDAWEEWIFNY